MVKLCIFSILFWMATSNYFASSTETSLPRDLQESIEKRAALYDTHLKHQQRVDLRENNTVWSTFVGNKTCPNKHYKKNLLWIEKKIQNLSEQVDNFTAMIHELKINTTLYREARDEKDLEKSTDFLCWLSITCYPSYDAVINAEKKLKKTRRGLQKFIKILKNFYSEKIILVTLDGLCDFVLNSKMKIKITHLGIYETQETAKAEVRNYIQSIYFPDE